MLVPAVPASAAGSHGPLTCLDGFVWRQATPRDHVCVTPEARAQTPGTWQQVHDDNLMAGARRNALRVKVGTTDDRAPRYWVRVDGINVGMARVGLFAPAARTPRKTWPVRARRNPTGLGGVLFYRTGLAHCGPKPDSVIRVQDPSSRRWSSPRPVATACAT